MIFIKKKIKKETFQQEKIISLNRFFMKNVGIGCLLIIIVFVISFSFVIIIINYCTMDNGLRISLISMVATFILTTGRTIIDKLITIIKFMVSLLSEEQRGLNKNIGIHIEKIAYDDNPNNTEGE